MPLSGKVVLVTGATGGLGPCVARAIAAEGAYLAVAGRDAQRAAALARELADARGFAADLTEEADAARLAAAVREHVGEVYGLVHLVGGWEGGRPVAETPLELWERMLALNLRSAFLVARAVLPGMLEAGQGKIVFVAARAACADGAGSGAYAVAKAALVRLVEVLAEEVRGRGVEVNAVAPSVIDTPANRRAMPKARHDTWVKPEEIARAIVFLLQSEVVTGDVVKAYGRA